ncbi:MAG: extensin family protein [Sandaracinaceae bacterium]|nr:extensin family protein [Sandaracinaceae bacterium]
MVGRLAWARGLRARRGLGPRAPYRHSISVSLLACVLVTSSLVHGQARETLDVGEDCTLALAPRMVAIPAVPRGGRALGALESSQCEQLLRDASVPFESIGSVAGVGEPVRLRGPIGDGVAIRTQGAAPRARGGPAPHDPRFEAVFDCRLVLALRVWARWVHEAGFEAIEHVSVLRPHARVAATGRVSGHAHALAIDVLALVRPDGSRFTILDGWTSRSRGADPCAHYDESAEQARVRALVCRGVQEGLFQIVITPHHDDRHANHVHLEIRPDVDWAIAR